jgi:hypothetical protein
VGTNVLAYYTHMGEVVKQLPDQFGYFKVEARSIPLQIEPGPGFLLLHLLTTG